MSDNILEWGLIAKDDASAVFEKVAKAEAELVKSSNETAKAVSGSASSWKSVATGVITGQAALQAASRAFGMVKEAISSSIQEAAEFERNQAQLSAALTSTGGAAGVTLKELNDMAGELSHLTAVDDDVINSMQAMQLTFTNITRETFKETSKAAIDMATAMNGGVLPSADELRAQMIQLGKAMNDPKEGINALTRVGVKLTEQQKQQIETMLRHNDVIGAQKIVLAELAKEFGGSAEAAANSFQGRMMRLHNAMGDVQKIIGQVIVAAVSPFIEEITDATGKVQINESSLRSWQLHLYQAAVIVRGVVGVIGSWIKVLYDAANVTFLAGKTIVSAMVDVEKILLGVVAKVFHLGEAFRIVVSGIKALINSDLVQAAKSFAQFAGDAIGKTFSSITKKVVDASSGFMDEHMKLTVASFNELKGSVATLGNDVKDSFKPMQDALEEATNHKKFDALIKGMDDAAKKLGTAGVKPVANIGNEISGASDKIKDAMKTIGDDYKKAVGEASESLAKLEQSHAETTASITEKITDLKTQLKDLQDTYQQTMGDLNKTEAEKVVDQEKKIADLKKQIAEEEAKQSKDQQKETQNLIDLNEKLSILMLKQSEIKPSTGGSVRESLKDQIADVQRKISEAQTGGGDNRLAELKAQFQKEQNAYDQYYAKGVTSLDSEITEARRRAGLTEFERFVEDNNKKRTETQKEYDQKTALLKQNLTDQETALGQERIIYESKKAMYLETQTKFQEFHDSYVANLKSMGDHSEKILTLMKQKLGDINATLDAIEKAKTKAGIASAAGFTPIDQTASSGAASGGTQNQTVSINFGDVSINSQQQLNDLVNKITRQLQLVKVGSQ